MLNAFSTDFRTVRGSTAIAGAGRTPFQSDIASPRSHGLSARRENIACRVFVPVVGGPTFGARPLPDIKRQRFNYMPAGRASLTGGKETVDQFQFLSIPSALVLDHGSECAEGRITETLRQTVIASHSPDVQILHADYIEPANQTGSNFVQVVRSGIRDSSMDAGNLESLLHPSVASLFPSRKNSLGARQLLRPLREMLWVRDALASGKRGESVDARVNTDRRPGLRERGNLLVEHQRCKVSPIPALGYRNRGGGTLKRPGPVHIQPS